jgi:hypothetical protein
VKEAYSWGDRHPKHHSEKELAQWLRKYSSIDISRATQLKVFTECLVSGAAHNHPARVGKCKQEAHAASSVTQGDTKRSLMECMLDSDLDKDTAAAVASSSMIVVDDPTFSNKWVESHPFPTPYDQDDHMDTVIRR